MGYRSDVALACDPIIRDIIETVAEWDKETKDLLGYAEDFSADDFGRWQWSDIKWYESYPDVAVFESIMTFIEDTSEDGIDYGSFGFLRIGEELEDVEMKGCCSSFDIWVNRSISI